MLDVAIRYQEQLTDKFRSVWLKEKYKYWAGSTYFDDWEPIKNTWVDHQFVSIRNGEIIGYIGYSINRADGDVAHELNIVNFEEKPSITFSLDLGQALTDIFEKYNLRKLNFYVIVGNPAEKAYDKMIERYGGRVVGYRRKNKRLFDGKYYDDKLYEVMREDYFARKARDKHDLCTQINQKSSGWISSESRIYPQDKKLCIIMRSEKSEPVICFFVKAANQFVIIGSIKKGHSQIDNCQTFSCETVGWNGIEWWKPLELPDGNHKLLEEIELFKFHDIEEQ